MNNDKNLVNSFFEFFIEKMLWFWLPIHALHRVLKDILDEQENQA